MDTRGLSEEILANMERPAGAQLDPFTLMVLLAVLGQVIAHYTEKCLNRIDDSGLRNPGPLERVALRRAVSQGFRQHGRELQGEYGDRLYDAILATISRKTVASVRGSLGV